MRCGATFSTTSTTRANISLSRSSTRTTSFVGVDNSTFLTSKPPVNSRNCKSSFKFLASDGKVVCKNLRKDSRSPRSKADSQALSACPAGVFGTTGCAHAGASAKTRIRQVRRNIVAASSWVQAVHSPASMAFISSGSAAHLLASQGAQFRWPAPGVAPGTPLMKCWACQVSIPSSQQSLCIADLM